jgi:hypothetical protein
MSVPEDDMEAYRRFQILYLAPEDDQTSDVQGLPDWNTPRLEFDWAHPIHGRYTTIYNSEYSPYIVITQAIVDVMNTQYAQTQDIEQVTPLEFVFANDTSIQVWVFGQGANPLDVWFRYYNKATDEKTGIGTTNISITYNELADPLGLNGEVRMFPVCYHYKDSSDPNYHFRACWLAFFPYLVWMGYSGAGGHGGNADDWCPHVSLFSQNDWWSIPAWFWEGNEPPTDPNYPEEDDDYGGGYGTGIDIHEACGFMEEPEVSALGTGLVNIYTPTAQELKDFSHWLWSSNYYSNVEKLQASPMENIICFGAIPVDFPSVPETIKIGNLDSQLPANSLVYQYKEVPCGSLNVPEFFGGFLDYNAEYQIYLPFIGYKPLRPDDLTDGAIEVDYWVDLLTGNCQCTIATSPHGQTLSVLYSYSGNCLFELPISGANYARMKQGQMNSVISGATSLLGGAIKGGITGSAGGVGGAIGGAIVGGAMKIPDLINAKQSYDMQKPDYEHGGGLSGNAIFSCRTPYIIQTRYMTNYPSNYKKMKGIPSHIYRRLGDLSGYTEVENVIDDKLISCTTDEKEEIINMLKRGVIL